MKRFILAFFLIFCTSTYEAQAQNKRKAIPPAKAPAANILKVDYPKTAVVIDERLAVLRFEPSLYAKSIQRMRRGRFLTISGARHADGVTFYRVVIQPNNFGWVQADAVISKNKIGDDERLAKLVQASEGFEQIERAVLYLNNFPDSPLRPSILLLLGDLIEENAAKLSTEASKRLDTREMAATNAPLHSFYLNYNGLDRFRRMGINFRFNANTKKFHYDGTAWREITSKFPKSTEAEEAGKRLESLNQKLAQTTKP